MFYFVLVVINKKISKGRPKNSGVVARALSKAEVRRLLATTRDSGKLNQEQSQSGLRNEALLLTGFHTCGRISEICSLSVSDVLENGKVASSVLFRKTKSKKARRVPLSDDLQKKLGSYLNLFQHRKEKKSLIECLDSPLFPSNKGGHFHPTSGSKLVKDLLASAGITNAGASHIMRKTGLTMMHNAGCTLKALQCISGHSSISQLSTYLSATTNQVDAAVNTIKF